MARIDTLTNFLTDVANAIRSKKGTTAKISPSDFDTEIESIEGGGGGGTEKYAPRFIRFDNYNGTDLDHEVANLDTTNVTDMTNMFYNCRYLTNLYVNHFDTSNVTTLYQTFNNCTNLEELNVSAWDVSKVTSLYRTFYGCACLLNLDLSSWNIESSCTWNDTFDGCQKLQSIDLSNKPLKGSFSSFPGVNLTSLTSFNLSNSGSEELAAGSAMCSNCYNLEVVNFTGFKCKVTNMAAWFNNCSKVETLDLAGVVGSNITSIYNMFNGCSSLKHLDIRNLDFSNCTYSSTTYAFTNVPDTCEIIVKNDTMKSWFTTNLPGFTNVKTAEEYE